jgi:hypothetical protein
MAVQAASNTAATAAAAASGAAAAAGGAGFMSGLSNAVMGASVGVQVALVLGLMAVVAASVTSGVVVSANRANGEPEPGNVPTIAPSPTLSPSAVGTFPVFEDCEGVVPDIVTGGVIIYMDGPIRPFNDSELLEVEAGFVDVYNNVSGGCNDIYQRFMQSANITNQTLLSFENGTIYLDTQWSADVRCSGCEDQPNPFFEGDVDMSGRMLQAIAETNKTTIYFKDVIALFDAFLLDQTIIFATIEGIESMVAPMSAPSLAHTSQPPTSSPSLGDNLFDMRPTMQPSEPPTASPSSVVEDCEENPDNVNEGLTIWMDGLNRNFTGTEVQVVEDGFVYVYNNISGGCHDLYQRFMQSATITNQRLVPSEDGNHVGTQWNLDARCSGCQDNSSPLFDTVDGNRFLLASLAKIDFVDVVKLFEYYLLSIKGFEDITIINATTNDMENVYAPRSAPSSVPTKTPFPTVGASNPSPIEVEREQEMPGLTPSSGPRENPRSSPLPSTVLTEKAQSIFEMVPTSEPTVTPVPTPPPNAVDPTPMEPTPSGPTPSAPTPSEPTPSEPTPSEPTPSEPTPSEPTPSEPTPSEPIPSAPTPSELNRQSVCQVSPR